MGYRSYGACRIVGPKERMLDEISKLRLTDSVPEELDKVLDLCVLNPQGETELMLGFDIANWCWRAGYPDIDALERIWSHFSEMSDEFEGDEEVNCFQGGFVRIGENTEDIETRYFGSDPYDLVYVNRSCESAPLNPENDLRHSLKSNIE